MPGAAVVHGTQHCVWMTAGLIRYRLCNRGFDCRNCLLDAAMRGEFPAPLAPPDSAVPHGVIPDDRLYTPGHTWLQASDDDAGPWKMGLDAFAAAIIGRVTGFDWPCAALDRLPGEAVCHVRVESGAISLAAPIACRVACHNDLLRHHPDHAITDHYGAGWIVELVPTELADLFRLASPRTAQERLGSDVSRFCRGVALCLLGGDGAASACAAIRGGQPLADLHVLLDADRHLELLRAFVH